MLLIAGLSALAMLNGLAEPRYTSPSPPICFVLALGFSALLLGESRKDD